MKLESFFGYAYIRYIIVFINYNNLWQSNSIFIV